MVRSGIPEKILYLLGSGSTAAEMSRQGVESEVGMRDIGKNVLKLSAAKDGSYSRIQREFGLPEDQDIEIMMSLMEGSTEADKSEFNHVCNELRSLFRSYLISQIGGKNVKPRIHSALLHLHTTYGDQMGLRGEELVGVLTINYDSVTDEAFKSVFEGVNYGYNFESDVYKRDDRLPPLLKLHGSFNWKIESKSLKVSRSYEKVDYPDDCSGWMPPSVYKRPSEAVYKEIWEKARQLLVNCDALRVIGSSLRTEDFALISLIFSSQVRSKKPFRIDLIVPDKYALGDEGDSSGVTKGIMQRIPFLGKLRNFSSLPEFDKDSFVDDNVFYSWVQMKVREIEKNSGGSLRDDLLDKMLGGEA